MIIYMNQINNNKMIELNKSEINQIKELIYDRIDVVSGYENLEESLKELLKKLNKQ